MGLFTQNGNDLQSGNELLCVSRDRFNSISGLANSVEVSVSQDNLKRCCDSFEKISKLGFPAEPGPFKRLGGFAIMAMQWPLFHVASTHSSSDHEDLQLIWLPRIAVWTLPIFASAIELNGEGHCIRDLVLPTPHFQVEFIGFLRNMAHGRVKCGDEIQDSMLLERATATGLILEASAYAPPPEEGSSIFQLHSRASGCLDAISKDPILLDDMRFNDPEFLNLAAGMGFD